MIQLIIELAPAQEATSSFEETISLTIIPKHNIIFTGIIPGRIPNTTTKLYLTIREIGWYTRGIVIWADIPEEQGAEFYIQFHPTPLLAAGLSLRISAPAFQTDPATYIFPPGSLHDAGEKLKINLTSYIQRLLTHQTAEPQLFDNIPYQPSLQTTPLPAEERAQPLVIGITQLLRRTETIIQRQQTHHLNFS